MDSIFNLAWLIPLFPLLAFVSIALFAHRNRTLSQQIAINSVVVALVLALVVFGAAMSAGGQVPETTSFRWFALGGETVQIGLRIDPLSAVMLFVAPLIALVAFIYSTEALRDDPRISHFFAVLSLLVASVLGLAVFDNPLAFFICWEATDVCTYLLTGFWHERKSARDAALTAFLVGQVGSLCVLAGIVLLYMPTMTPSSSVAARAIALLLLGGVAAKSAQFPLHVGLLETSEAPAPAAALVHALAAPAGILLLARAYPLFEAAAPSLTIVTVVGVASAVFAALVAIAQRDVRRALSYSIASQLGYTVAALGTGALAAGIFHLVATMFTGALLFLAAGSVTHAMQRGGEEADPHDMYRMGGLYRRPAWMFWMFFIGGMALSGLPFFTACFWSKGALLVHLWASHRAVFWTLTATTTLTAFSAMRQVCLIFVGPPRSPAAERAPQFAPKMTALLAVLAAFAIGLGWLGIPEYLTNGAIPNWVAAFLGGGTATAFVWEPFSLEIAFGVMGLIVAFWVYAWKPVLADAPDRLETALHRARMGRLYRWLREGFYVGWLYRQAFARGAVALATAFDRFDHLLNRLADGIAWCGQWLAQAGRGFDAHVSDALAHMMSRAGQGLAYASNVVDLRLDWLTTLAGGATKGLATASNAVDLRLDWLTTMTSGAGKGLATVSNAVDLGLDHLSPLTSRVSKWSATVFDGFDLGVDRVVVSLTRVGAQGLAHASGWIDRQALDGVVNGVGIVVKAAGLGLRPKSNKVQLSLLVAMLAVLILTVIFVFLFSGI